MNIDTLKTELYKLNNSIDGIKNTDIDDFNSEIASIYIEIELPNSEIKNNYMDNYISYLSKTEKKENGNFKRSIAAKIKKFFKDRFNATIYLRYDESMNGYFFDFYYAFYDVSMAKKKKNLYIYIRDIYENDIEFKENVEGSFKTSNSIENFIEKLKNIYSDYTVEPLWTFRHGPGVTQIERFERCRFDSSLNGFVAYKNEIDLENKLSELNNNLN